MGFATEPGKGLGVKTVEWMRQPGPRVVPAWASHTARGPFYIASISGLI